MPNIFSSFLEAEVFRITTDTMGFDAVWLPSLVPDTEHTARVHFQDPNKIGDKYEVKTVDFRALQPFMEYFEGDFPGLCETVEEAGGTTHEIVSIEGVEYSVASVAKKWDGRTYRAVLLPI